MRIVITGVNGLIGRRLAPTLIHQGHDVSGIGRRVVSATNGLRYASGDILDERFVAEQARGADAVIHLAGPTTHAALAADPLGAADTIVWGTRNALRALARPSAPSRARGEKTFIFASSGKVYGRIRTVPITEDHVTDPLNVLGKCKVMAERLVDYYSSEFDRSVSLRIFNVYGPGQDAGFLVPTILKQLSSPKIVLGDIKAKRDYVYVDDVVDAIVKALGVPVAKRLQTYNVCSGIGSSAEDIVRAIEQVKGKARIVRSRANMGRQDEQDVEYGTSARFEQVTGWQPRHSLLDGLRATLQDQPRTLLDGDG